MRAIDRKARKSRKQNKSRRPAKPKAKKAPARPTGETLIAFLMDETGSMLAKRDEAVIGFNEYVKKVRAEKKYRHRLSLRFFSSEREHNRDVQTRIDLVLPLEDEYKPSGSTPLYDAITKMIHDIDSIGHKGNILMVILTDGEENCSRKATRETVKELIQKKQAEGWNFIYLGSNQDAWVQGGYIGLHIGQTMTYDDHDTRATYAVAAAATVHNTRATRGMKIGADTLAVTKEWKDEARRKGKSPIKDLVKEIIEDEVKDSKTS